MQEETPQHREHRLMMNRAKNKRYREKKKALKNEVKKSFPSPVKKQAVWVEKRVIPVKKLTGKQTKERFRSQFKKELAESLEDAPVKEKPKRRLRFRTHVPQNEGHEHGLLYRLFSDERYTPKNKKVKHVIDRIAPEALPPSENRPDVISEQKERPMTTPHCPQSIKEDGLYDVKTSPESYIEINVITKSRVVDSFYVPSETKKFRYKKIDYDIDEEAIYLLPTKSGYFVPSSYYKEGITTPKGFKQTNKGITGKAFSLLYMEQLYTSLLYSDETKYNLFIVILSIALLCTFIAGLYLTIFYNGGVFPVQPPVMQPITGV